MRFAWFGGDSAPISVKLFDNSGKQIASLLFDTGDLTPQFVAVGPLIVAMENDGITAPFVISVVANYTSGAPNINPEFDMDYEIGDVFAIGPDILIVPEIATELARLVILAPYRNATFDAV